LAASDVIATALNMITADNQSRPDGVNQFHAIDVLCVTILIVYFLHFALPALGGGFGEDEILAIFTTGFREH